MKPISSMSFAVMASEPEVTARTAARVMIDTTSPRMPSPLDRIFSASAGAASREDDGAATPPPACSAVADTPRRRAREEARGARTGSRAGRRFERRAALLRFRRRRVVSATRCRVTC